MKKSQDVLGLLVFSIIDGREVGQVRDLIINPEDGAIQYLLVYNGDWLAGVRVLPYAAVNGVGEHAITTESENELSALLENQEAIALVKRGIKVKDTRVMTKAGNIIGAVTEYAIDTDNGKIVEVEWTSGADASGVIPASQVLTFGKDVLIFEDKADGSPAPRPVSKPAAPPVEPAPAASPIAEEPVQAPEAEQADEKPGSQLFVERQKQFLGGKYLTKDIVDNDGNILASSGTQLTPGLLNLLDIKGKLMEVSQNVR